MNKKDKEQIIKGMLTFAVLTQLAGSPKYGAELLSILSKTPFATQIGTLYPLLNRLSADGLISHAWQESTYGPPRKYYTLSKAGTQYLRELQKYWRELHKHLGGGK